MKVKIRRVHDFDLPDIDVKAIYPDSIRWSTDFTVGGTTWNSTPYYFITAQIDYLVAMDLGLASGEHKDYGGRANIRIYKKDNTAPEYKEGYAWVCQQAGTKPKMSWNDGNNVADEVRKLVEETPGILSKDVVKILVGRGFDKTRVQNAIHRLKNVELKSKKTLIGVKQGTSYKLYLK